MKEFSKLDQLRLNHNIYIPTSSYTAYLEYKEHLPLRQAIQMLHADFTLCHPKRTSSFSQEYPYNQFLIDEKQFIYFYPVNDGMPTTPFVFLQKDKKILTNEHNYLEISNLDDVLVQMVEIMHTAFYQNIVLDPYAFLLRLEDELEEDYHGKASIFLTDKTIKNQKLNEQNFKEARAYFINLFFDHFLGWNFGVSINRDSSLKKRLTFFNDTVIEEGIRQDAGPGLDVFSCDGVEHYKFPKRKVK